MLSGTFLNASISSEKHINFVSTLLSNTLRACLTIDVRATSPKVPICGKPEAP